MAMISTMTTALMPIIELGSIPALDYGENQGNKATNSHLHEQSRKKYPEQYRSDQSIESATRGFRRQGESGDHT
jgi:hypothetical protein